MISAQYVWYLALAVQLYIVFPFVNLFQSKYPKLLVIIVASLLVICGSLNDKIIHSYGIYLFSTPLAQLPIFVLGIFLAKGTKISYFIIPVALVLFVLSNFNQYFFMVSFISLVILVLYMTKLLSIVFRRSNYFPKICKIGYLSMFIYICHGDLRPLLTQVMNESNNIYIHYIGYFGYLIMVLIFSYLCKYLFNLITKRVIVRL